MCNNISLQFTLFRPSTTKFSLVTSCVCQGYKYSSALVPILLSVTPTVVGSNGTLSWAEGIASLVGFDDRASWNVGLSKNRAPMGTPKSSGWALFSLWSRNWDTAHFRTNPVVGSSLLFTPQKAGNAEDLGGQQHDGLWQQQWRKLDKGQVWQNFWKGLPPRDSPFCWTLMKIMVTTTTTMMMLVVVVVMMIDDRW